MSDDLVRRLRCYADLKDAIFHPWVYGEAADRIEALEADAQMHNEELNRALNRMIDRWEIQNARIEKLEAALRNIAEGDIPRTVKISFRDDGQSSKHDRCEHGQWFYEDCGCCIEDYARKALEGKDD